MLFHARFYSRGIGFETALPSGLRHLELAVLLNADRKRKLEEEAGTEAALAQVTLIMVPVVV